MKPPNKLNPIIQKQQPVINQLKLVNKLLQQIKSLLNDANQTPNDSFTKGLEKLVEEAAKQKKIMNRVRLAIETKNQGAMDNSIVVEREEEGNGRVESERQREGAKTDEIKQLVLEQNKLLRKQNEVLATTSSFLSSMGSIMANIQTKITSEHTSTHHSTTPSSNIDIIFQQMQSTLFKNPKDNQTIQKWVGELIRIAAQDAFVSYSSKMQQDQVRMLFSSFVLDNYRKYIVKLAKVPNINIEFVEKIFYDSCKKTLEYLKFKFPQSKKKISDMSLTEKIQSTSKKVQPESDIIRGGNVQLDFSRVTDLRSSVKRLVNELIIHGNQKYEMFKKKMLDLFIPVEKEDKEDSFYFLIGRKIKETTPIYTDTEIQSPGNFVKGNEILRILMKWIEQLMQYFINPDKIKGNSSGFKTIDSEIKKLGIKDRQKLWSKFQSMNTQLTKQLKQIENQLRKTVTNIILMSENQVGSKFGKQVDFLNKQQTSLIIICQYIYKALESYVMDVIVAILNRFNAIKQSYVDLGEEEADLQLYTLTIGDLFRCKCSGTKDQILQVYENLTLKDKNGDSPFKILRVKNRLAEGTQDILINFMMKPQQSFFICQIQLALSTAHQQINDHFNHFLYQQHRSPHGVITQLGIMLFNLDTRRLYLNKHKLVFINKTPKFQYTPSRLSCITHPSSQLIKKQKIKYYVCSNCGRFIDAYRFYFDAEQCPICFNNVCPMCQFTILPQQEVVKRMYEFAPKVEGYFTMIGKPFLNQHVSSVKEKICELLKVNKYLGVMWLKNNMDSFQFKVIKMFKTEVALESDDEEEDEEEDEEDNQNTKKDQILNAPPSPTKQQNKLSQPQKTHNNKKPPSKKKIVQYILTSFSNLQFAFQNLQDSIVFLLKPTNLHQLLFSTFSTNQQTQAQLHQDLYDIQQNDFDPDDQDNEDLYMIENTVSKKKLIVDYNVSDAKELVSKAKIKRVIKHVGNGMKSIALDDFILENLDELGVIGEKERRGVVEIELSRGVTYDEYYGQINNKNQDQKEEGENEKEDDEKGQNEQDDEGQEGQEGQNQDKNQKQIKPQQLQQPQPQQPQVPNPTTQLQILSSFPNISILSFYSIFSFSNFISFPFSSLLTQLSIKKCSLSSFDFALVPKTRIIDFTNNFLISIPIISNQHLESLIFDENFITDCSNLTKCQLPKLSKLLMNDNQIVEFPKVNFPELRVMGVIINKLRSIENLKVSTLPKLKNLLLEQNQIQCLPDISHLKQLTKLSICFNKLSSILFTTHPKLQILTLTDNSITIFPKLSMNNLRQLYLDSNKISDPTVISTILSCTDATYVSLLLNDFQELPLEKTKIAYLYVEMKKVKWDMGNIWDEGQSGDYNCHKCKENITTVGFYVKKEEEELYCKKCGEGAEGMELCVEITQDYMR